MPMCSGEERLFSDTCTLAYETSTRSGLRLGWSMPYRWHRFHESHVGSVLRIYPQATLIAGDGYHVDARCAVVFENLCLQTPYVIHGIARCDRPPQIISPLDEVHSLWRRHHAQYEQAERVRSIRLEDGNLTVHSSNHEALDWSVET